MASEQEQGTSEGYQQRRSERKRKDRQPVFSPDDFESKKKAAADFALSSTPSAGKKRRHVMRRRHPAASAADRPHDVLPNGEPFSCDLCQSPYVCNPHLSKRGSRGHRSRHMPSPRQKLNNNTGKLLTLCNACADSLDGPRPAKPVVKVSQEEKDAYCKQAKAFASQLSAQLQDEDAERFYCPMYNKTPCGCLQKHLRAEGNEEQMVERGKQLLQLHKQAKKLASEKVYNLDELVKKYASRKKAKYGSIGIGNGNKHSKRFEAFILQHRASLKHDLHLCERATQRILCYSNNFLHKKLKTDERGSRVVRQKGKAALGLLDPLESLGRRRCCVDQCVRMVNSHRNLVTQWRKRAVLNQSEARRVLAEMLTPSGGVRCNCYKFINWVTGCSHSTIGKVRDQMRRTKGDREPPQHGLYTYWELKTSCRQHKAGSRKHRTQPSATTVMPDQQNSDFSDMPGVLSDVSPSPDVSLTAVAGGNPVTHIDVDGGIESQRKQLLQLQDQLLQQQASISHQQQSVQQQIGWSHSASNLVNIQQQVLQQMSQLHSAQQSLASSIHTLQQQLATLQPAAAHHPPPYLPLTAQPQHHLVPQPISQPQVVDFSQPHLIPLGAQWAAPVAQQHQDAGTVQQQQIIPVGSQQLVSLSPQQAALSVAQQPPDSRTVLQQQQRQLVSIGGEQQHLVSLGGVQQVAPAAGVPLQQQQSQQFVPAAPPVQQVPDAHHPSAEVVTSHLPRQYLAPVDGTQWIVQQQQQQQHQQRQGVCGPGPLQTYPHQSQSGASMFTQLMGCHDVTAPQPQRFQHPQQQQQSPYLQTESSSSSFSSSSSQALLACIPGVQPFQTVACPGQAAMIQDGSNAQQQNIIRQQWPLSLPLPQSQQQTVTAGQQVTGSAQPIMLAYLHPGGPETKQYPQPSQHNLLQPSQHQNLQAAQQNLQSTQQNLLQPTQQTVLQPTQHPTYQNVLQSAQQNVLQSTQQSLLQSTQQNLLQSTHQSLIQSTQQNILQSTQQNLIQSTQQNLIQSTQQNFLQPAQQNLLQSTQQNLLQSTQQNLIQSTHQNLIQSTQHNPPLVQLNLLQSARQDEACEMLHQPPTNLQPPAAAPPGESETPRPPLALLHPATPCADEPQGNQQLFRPPPYQTADQGRPRQQLGAPCPLLVEGSTPSAAAAAGAASSVASASRGVLLPAAVPLLAGLAQAVPLPASFPHIIPLRADGVVQAVPFSAGVTQAVSLSAGVAQNAPLLAGVSQTAPLSVGATQTIITPSTVVVDDQDAPPLAGVSQTVPLSTCVTQTASLLTDVSQSAPLPANVSQTVPLSAGAAQTVWSSIGETRTVSLSTGAATQMDPLSAATLAIVQPNLPTGTAVRPKTQISSVATTMIHTSNVVRPNTQTSTVVRPNTQTSPVVRPNIQISTVVRPNAQTSVVRPNAPNSTVVRPNSQVLTAVRPDFLTSSAVTVRPNSHILNTVKPNTSTSAAERPDAQTSTTARPNAQTVLMSEMPNTMPVSTLPNSQTTATATTLARPAPPTSTLVVRPSAQQTAPTTPLRLNAQVLTPASSSASVPTVIITLPPSSSAESQAASTTNLQQQLVLTAAPGSSGSAALLFRQPVDLTRLLLCPQLFPGRTVIAQPAAQDGIASSSGGPGKAVEVSLADSSDSHTLPVMGNGETPSQAKDGGAHPKKNAARSLAKKDAAKVKRKNSKQKASSEVALPVSVNYVTSSHGDGILASSPSAGGSGAVSAQGVTETVTSSSVPPAVVPQAMEPSSALPQPVRQPVIPQTALSATLPTPVLSVLPQAVPSTNVSLSVVPVTPQTAPSSALPQSVMSQAVPSIAFPQPTLSVTPQTATSSAFLRPALSVTSQAVPSSTLPHTVLSVTPQPVPLSALPQPALSVTPQTTTPSAFLQPALSVTPQVVPPSTLPQTALSLPQTALSVMPQPVPSAAMPQPVLTVTPQAVSSSALPQTVLSLSQTAFSVMSQPVPSSALPQPALSSLSQPALPATLQPVTPSAALQSFVAQTITPHAATPQPAVPQTSSVAKSKPRVKAAVRGSSRKRSKGTSAREKGQLVAGGGGGSVTVSKGAASCGGLAHSVSSSGAQTGLLATAEAGSLTVGVSTSLETLATPQTLSDTPSTHVVPRITNKTNPLLSQVTSTTASITAQATPFSVQATPLATRLNQSTLTTNQATPIADQATPHTIQVTTSFSTQTASSAKQASSSVVYVASSTSQGVSMTSTSTPSSTLHLRSVPTLLLSSSGVQPSKDVIAVINFASDAGFGSSSLGVVSPTKTSSTESVLSSASVAALKIAAPTTTTVSVMPPSLRSLPTVLLSTPTLVHSQCSGRSGGDGAKRNKKRTRADLSVTSSSVAAAASTDVVVSVSAAATGPKRKRKKTASRTQSAGGGLIGNGFYTGFSTSLGDGSFSASAGDVPARGITFQPGVSKRVQHQVPSSPVAHISVPPTAAEPQAQLSAVTTTHLQAPSITTTLSPAAAVQPPTTASIASAQCLVVTSLATTQPHVPSIAATQAPVLFISTPQSSNLPVTASQVQIRLAPISQSHAQSDAMAHSQIASTEMVQSQLPAFATMSKSSVSSSSLKQSPRARPTASISRLVSATSNSPKSNVRGTVPQNVLGAGAGRTDPPVVTAPVQVIDVAVPVGRQAGTVSSVADLPLRWVDASVPAKTTAATSLPNRSATQTSNVSFSKTSNSGAVAVSETEHSASPSLVVLSDLSKSSTKPLPVPLLAKKRGAAKGVRHSSTLISAVAGPSAVASDSAQFAGKGSCALTTSAKTTAQAMTTGLPTCVTSAQCPSHSQVVHRMLYRTTSTGFAVSSGSTQISSQPVHSSQATTNVNAPLHSTTQSTLSTSTQPMQNVSVDYHSNDVSRQIIPEKTPIPFSVQTSSPSTSQKKATFSLPRTSSPVPPLPQTLHSPAEREFRQQTGSLQPQVQAGPAPQTTPDGFPVSVMPVGEGKQQMMCITSPMNFQQLKVLLSHLKLPVGSVVKQISSPVKGGLLPARVGLAEVTVPQSVDPDRGEPAASIASLARQSAPQIKKTTSVFQNATPLSVQQTATLGHRAVPIVLQTMPQVQHDAPSSLRAGTNASTNETSNSLSADVAGAKSALPAASQRLAENRGRVNSKNASRSGGHLAPKNTGRGKCSRHDKTRHVAASSAADTQLTDTASRSEHPAFETSGSGTEPPVTSSSCSAGNGFHSSPSSLVAFTNVASAKPGLHNSSSRSGRFSGGCSSFVSSNPIQKYPANDQRKPSQPPTSSREYLTLSATGISRHNLRTSVRNAGPEILLEIVSSQRDAPISADASPPMDTGGYIPSDTAVQYGTQGAAVISATTSSVPPEGTDSLRLSESVPSATFAAAPLRTTQVSKSNLQINSATSRQPAFTDSLQHFSGLEANSDPKQQLRSTNAQVSLSKQLKTSVDSVSSRTASSEETHIDTGRNFRVVKTHASSVHISGSVKTCVHSSQHSSTAKECFNVNPNRQTSTASNHPASTNRNQHPAVNVRNQLFTSASAKPQIQSGAGCLKNPGQTSKPKLPHAKERRSPQATQPKLATSAETNVCSLKANRKGAAVTGVWHKRDSSRMPPTGCSAGVVEKHVPNSAFGSSLPATVVSSETKPVDRSTHHPGEPNTVTSHAVTNVTPLCLTAVDSATTTTTTIPKHFPGAYSGHPGRDARAFASCADQERGSSIVVTPPESHQAAPLTRTLPDPAVAVRTSAPVAGSTAPSPWPVLTASYAPSSVTKRKDPFASTTTSAAFTSWVPASSSGGFAATDHIKVVAYKANSPSGQRDNPHRLVDSPCEKRDDVRRDRPRSPHGPRPDSPHGPRLDDVYRRDRTLGNTTDNPVLRETPQVPRTDSLPHRDESRGLIMSDHPFHRGNPNGHRTGNPLHGIGPDNALHRESLHGYRTGTPNRKDDHQTRGPDNPLHRINPDGQRSDNPLYRDISQGHRNDNPYAHRTDNPFHSDYPHEVRSDNPVHRDSSHGHRNDNSHLHRIDNPHLHRADNPHVHRNDNPIHRDNPLRRDNSPHGHRNDNPHVHRADNQIHRDNPLHRDNSPHGQRIDNPHVPRTDNSLHRDNNNLHGHNRADNHHLPRADNPLHRDNISSNNLHGLRPDNSSHEHSSHPAHFPPFDRFLTASPAVLLPPCPEPDDASRDMEYLSSSSFFPFMSSNSRSRNSSGASSIEPTIAIDPALLPFDFMQIMTHQGGLAVAVTGELAPPGGNEDSS